MEKFIIFHQVRVMREGHPSEGFRRGEKKIFWALSLVGLAVCQLKILKGFIFSSHLCLNSTICLPFSFCIIRWKLRCSSWWSRSFCPAVEKDFKGRQKAWKRRRRKLELEEFWIRSKNGCEMAHHLISLMPTLPTHCTLCRAIKFRAAKNWCFLKKKKTHPVPLCVWLNISLISVVTPQSSLNAPPQYLCSSSVKSCDICVK